MPPLRGAVGQDWGVKAIQIKEFGGPEALEHVEIPDPVAARGEVIVEVTRSGVNFADVHASTNDYVAKHELPLIPGAEVVGHTPDGRRVAAILRKGGYAEKVAVHEGSLVEIPDDVSDDQAAGVLLQGLTAHAVIHRSARLQSGETVVVEAAAGGTGGLAVQVAKRAGARVIALASSSEKRALAERLGADAAVDSRSEKLGAAILEANYGEQVDAVLQMSGGSAFDAELRVLAPFGRMVVVGIATREQNTVRTGHLLRNSRSVIGFWLYHLLPETEAVAEIVVELFEAVGEGALEVVIGGVYPLCEARAAHEAMTSRSSTGKLLLDPSS
ncbi:zinc-binding dehydrogenase [soil metagenome]